MKSQDKYAEPVVEKYPNAIVTVLRPILTDEERQRRMKVLNDAAAAVFISKEGK